MTDVELQVEVQLMSNSPAEHALGGLQEDFSGEESDCMESPQNTGEGGQITYIITYNVPSML